MNSAELAQNIERDPARVKETIRYYVALVTTMNRTERGDGTQDGMCVLEAIAMLVAQVTSGFGDGDVAANAVKYVYDRALSYQPEFAGASKSAKHFIEDLN